MPNEKVCKACLQKLSTTEFYVDGEFYRGRCKPCDRTYRKTIYPSCQKKAKQHYHKKRSIDPKFRLKALLKSSFKGKVDRSQLDFDWCWNRLVQNDFKCEITGIPFTWGTNEPTVMSIDRIDSTKGYTQNNVRFVCWWINAAMGNWGLDKLQELITHWRNNDAKV